MCIYGTAVPIAASFMIIVNLHVNTTGISVAAAVSSDSEVIIIAVSSDTIWKCKAANIARCGIRTAVEFDPIVVIIIFVSSVNSHVGIIWLSSLSTSI